MINILDLEDDVQNITMLEMNYLLQGRKIIHVSALLYDELIYKTTLIERLEKSMVSHIKSYKKIKVNEGQIRYERPFIDGRSFERNSVIVFHRIHLMSEEFVNEFMCILDPDKNGNAPVVIKIKGSPNAV